jgi:CRISPR-associated endonuclease Cas2
MYVIVAFDVSDEGVRGVMRRFLRSLGLSMVNRSVYAGVGGQNIAERIAEKSKEIIEVRDHVFIILVQESEYLRAIVCTKEYCRRIEDERFEVI